MRGAARIFGGDHVVWDFQSMANIADVLVFVRLELPLALSKEILDCSKVLSVNSSILPELLPSGCQITANS
jgi:hypothetical protein